MPETEVGCGSAIAGTELLGEILASFCLALFTYCIDTHNAYTPDYLGQIFCQTR